MPRLNFFRKRHNKERKEVLARLAASETISMISRHVEMSSAADHATALKRLRLLELVDDDEELEELLDTLLKWMRDSQLNINFRANNFFETASTDAKYMTKFEKMRTAGAIVTGSDGQLKGATRDVAEQKMFGYERKGGGIPPNSPGYVAAGNRIQAFGDLDSPEFQGAIRPKYCTLNVWRVVDGSGAQWGKSHFVLKDHLKTTSSFVHSDSFDFAGGGSMMGFANDKFKLIKANDTNVSATVATYTNMTRAIINASDNMLDPILDIAFEFTASKQPFANIQSKYKLGPTAYIEAHIHGEVYFNRDIAAAKISLEEVNSGTNPEAIKKNLMDFSTRYGVPVTYY